MSNVEFPPLTVDPVSAKGRSTGRSEIASICYRSKAARALSEEDLETLLRQARTRNRRETLTGMMIYDAGAFFQWLEGPPERLARVWSSICSDARHKEIEVMGRATFPMRFYAEWDMQFLRRADSGRLPTPTGGASGGDAHQPGPERLLIPPAEVARFARLILESDPAAAYEMIDEFLKGRTCDATSCASLFEPAARELGDLWGADRCSAFDVSLGLSRLTSALRRLDLPGPAGEVGPGSGFEVLVVPVPGEEHLLGATLEAEALWQQGYGVNCEFPATPDDLNRLVTRRGFDVLSLALSPTFGRQHWVPRIRTLIQAVRIASRNPTLVVTISGRMYFSPVDGATAVGADAHCGSTREVLSSIAVARVAQERVPAAEAPKNPTIQ